MLPRSRRVSKDFFKKPAEFSRSVSRPLISGRRASTGENDEAKVSVIVSKKVSATAPNRNKIRRRVYQAVRPQLPHLLKGFAYFLYPRKESQNAKFDSLSKQIQEILFELSKN